MPAGLEAQLREGLYGSIFIFVGGVGNSIAIAAIAVSRQPAPAFKAWLLTEIVLGLVRLPLLMWNRAALRRGDPPLERLTVVLSCAWAASVGFGSFICLTSGDMILATITCLSTAAMVCGICLRNFGTPRLASAMVVLALAPLAAAGILAAEPILAVISVQLPIYMMAIFSSAFALHGLLAGRMKAADDLEKSELLTRTILQSSPDYTLIVDAEQRVLFCNIPEPMPEGRMVPVGAVWTDFLPASDRQSAAEMIEAAAAGTPGFMVTSYSGEAGKSHWFHLAANRIADDTNRVIIVSRDITSQKSSEETALWMARHDPLTGLSNRTVLQERLDAIFADPASQAASGLLFLDVDNFKAINDALGHDAGDALLCAFADRLRAAVRSGDLVARTGGDEFAIVVSAHSDRMLQEIGERIYTALQEPFYHAGRLLECNASIGASLLSRDGQNRSEILKAADIALYSGKAAGRGQLKIFKPAMKAEVLRRDEMMLFARTALDENRVVPFFQPKISLRTWEMSGFEALLRWQDSRGETRGPDELKAAFEDPTLSAAISDRIIERALDQMVAWRDADVPFGHVAINATAADFRRKGFADKLIEELSQRGLPASSLQVEVTETVFLGRGAGYVEEALKLLSARGVRIALDDFGTGYASLSHLNQFPIDILKIDRSFVQDIGTSGEAAAIAAAIVNLGHCLGMEIVGEGIETSAQEAQLLSLGCDTAQGFHYSAALTGSAVPHFLKAWRMPEKALALG